LIETASLRGLTLMVDHTSFTLQRSGG